MRQVRLEEDGNVPGKQDGDEIADTEREESGLHSVRTDSALQGRPSLQGGGGHPGTSLLLHTPLQSLTLHAEGGHAVIVWLGELNSVLLLRYVLYYLIL